MELHPSQPLLPTLSSIKLGEIKNTFVSITAQTQKLKPFVDSLAETEQAVLLKQITVKTKSNENENRKLELNANFSFVDNLERMNSLLDTEIETLKGNEKKVTKLKMRQADYTQDISKYSKNESLLQSTVKDVADQIATLIQEIESFNQTKKEFFEQSNALIDNLENHVDALKTHPNQKRLCEDVEYKILEPAGRCVIALSKIFSETHPNTDIVKIHERVDMLKYKISGIQEIENSVKEEEEKMKKSLAEVKIVPLPAPTPQKSAGLLASFIWGTPAAASPVINVPTPVTAPPDNETPQKQSEKKAVKHLVDLAQNFIEQELYCSFYTEKTGLPSTFEFEEHFKNNTLTFENIGKMLSESQTPQSLFREALYLIATKLTQSVYMTKENEDIVKSGFTCREEGFYKLLSKKYPNELHTIKNAFELILLYDDTNLDDKKKDLALKFPYFQFIIAPRTPLNGK